MSPEAIPKKEQFAFAQDLTKQLLTLASGIIALTITFLKDVAAENGGAAQGWIQAAWVAYLISISFGVLTLMSLTDNIAKDKSIHEKETRIVAGVQIVSFAIALLLTVIFGFEAL
jgi:hypothetical protein